MDQRKSNDQEDDLHLSEAAAEEVDLEDLIAQIHSAEVWEPTRPRRHARGGPRSARRRLDDLAQDRALRDALVDWDSYDDYEDYEDLLSR